MLQGATLLEQGHHCQLAPHDITILVSKSRYLAEKKARRPVTVQLNPDTGFYDFLIGGVVIFSVSYDQRKVVFATGTETKEKFQQVVESLSRFYKNQEFTVPE